MRGLAFTVVFLAGCGLNDLGSAELASDASGAEAPPEPGPGSDNPGVLLDGGVVPGDAGGQTPPSATTCASNEAYCPSNNACTTSCDDDCSDARRACTTCGSGASPPVAVCTRTLLCEASGCSCNVSSDCPQKYEVCAAGLCVYCGTTSSIDKDCKGGGTCGPCGRFIYCHGECGGPGGRNQ